VTHIQVNNNASVSADGARWSCVGSSTDTDSFVAGMAAAAEASGGDGVALYLVLAGRNHDHERLVAGVAAQAPAGAIVVGCTASEETAVVGPADDGAVVLAVGGEGIAVSTRCADVVGGDYRTAGEYVANCAWDLDDRGHTAVMLLSNASPLDVEQVMAGALLTTASSIPVVSAQADDSRANQAALFHATSAETRIGADQVIGIAISTAAPLNGGTADGWESVSDLLSSVSLG